MTRRPLPTPRPSAPSVVSPGLHPMQFTGPSMRATIDRSKTMTRRVITESEAKRCMGLHKSMLIDLSRATVDPGFPDSDGVNRYGYLKVPFAHPDDGWEISPGDDARCRCVPKWAPGDILWCREAWGIDECGSRVSLSPEAWPEGWPTRRLIYDANKPLPAFCKRNPMFMPLWACRCFLRVEAVRAERVQEITRGDAMAEGCPFANMADGTDPRAWFAEHWDSINAKRSPWARNDWVWVITYSVLSATGVEGLAEADAAVVRAAIERLAKARKTGGGR